MPKSKNKPISKNTKLPNRKERRRSLQKPQIEKRKVRWFLRVAKNLFSSVLFWVLSLISIVSFLFLVYPRIAVYPGESLDSHDPFQTPFMLKNDGYLSIYNINYSVTIEKMEDVNQNKFTNNDIYLIGNIIPRLNANKGSAIFINRVAKFPTNFIKYVELRININYQPKFIPHTFTENIRFKTSRKNTGEYVWLEDYKY